MMIAMLNCMVSSEAMQQSSFHFPSQDTSTAPPVEEQIEGEVLDEVVHVVAQTLAIERVQDRVTCPVRNGAGPVSLTTFAEAQGLTSESSLVDLALARSAEGTS